MSAFGEGYCHETEKTRKRVISFCYFFFRTIIPLNRDYCANDILFITYLPYYNFVQHLKTILHYKSSKITIYNPFL